MKTVNNKRFATQYSLEDKLEYYQTAVAYLEGEALRFATMRIEQLEKRLNQKRINEQVRKAWDEHHARPAKKKARK